MREIIERYCKQYEKLGRDRAKMQKLSWDMLLEMSEKSAFANYKESYNMFNLVWHEAQSYVEQDGCGLNMYNYCYSEPFLLETLRAYEKYFEPNYVDFLEMADGGKDEKRDN